MRLLFLLMLLSDINYETAHLERRLKATRTSETITIDGTLSETAWSDASVATNFSQSLPKEGQPAVEATDVRVLYDSENIYFGVYAHDSHSDRIIINELKKDFSTDPSDTVELVLDTFHDQRNGYLFWTNAAGARGDAQMINEGREVNANWDGVWYVKTRIIEDGWIAEIAIPFKALKFRETDIQTWGINFHRHLRSDGSNEDSYWSPVQRVYNIQRVSLAGTLEDLEGIKPGSNIRMKPYITSSFAQNGATGVRKGDGDFGFDAKYGISAGLTWDFTYNTDFSQVEADDQQINLTRFNLFFPEKREFFLENSGIFKFGGADPNPPQSPTSGRQNQVATDVLFFSRNIGLTSDGTAVPILGGTRLTGRAGSYELGFLNMQQREYGQSHATNFTVGRVKHNIFANSDVGVIVLNKELKDSPLYDRVLGTDANLRFGQYTTVNASLAKSSLPGITSQTIYRKKQRWVIKTERGCCTPPM